MMGEAMVNIYLIQFSVDGRGCVPSLLFDLRPNYGGGNEDNGDLLQNLHRTEKQTFGGHKRNLMCTRTLKKGAVTPQETDPDLPESIQ